MSDSGGKVEAPAISNPKALSLPSDTPRPPAETADKQNPAHQNKVNDKSSNAMGNQQGSGKDSSNETHECCIAKSPKRQRKEKSKKKGSPDNSPLPYYKYEEKKTDATVKRTEKTETNVTSLPSESDDKCCDVDVSDFVIVDTDRVNEAADSSRLSRSKPVPIKVPAERKPTADDKEVGKTSKKEELSSSVDNTAPPPPSPSQLASFYEEDEEIENEDDYMETRSKEIIDHFGNSVCQRLSVLVDSKEELSVDTHNNSEVSSDISSDLCKSITHTGVEQDVSTPHVDTTSNSHLIKQAGDDIQDSKPIYSTLKSDSVQDKVIVNTDNSFSTDAGKAVVLQNIVENSSTIVIPESPTCRFVPDSPTLKFIPSIPMCTSIPEAPVVMRKIDQSSRKNRCESAEAENTIKENEKTNDLFSSDNLSPSKKSCTDTENNQYKNKIHTETLEPKKSSTNVTPPKESTPLIQPFPDVEPAVDNTKQQKSRSDIDVNGSYSEGSKTLAEHDVSKTSGSKCSSDEGRNVINPTFNISANGISCNNNEPVTPELSVTSTDDCLLVNSEQTREKNIDDANDSGIVEEVIEARSASNFLHAGIAKTRLSHSISDEFNNNVNSSKDKTFEPLPVRPETIQSEKINGKIKHEQMNLDDQSDSNVSSGELSTPCNDSGPTAADIFAQTDSDSCPSAVEIDKNRLLSKSEHTTSNDKRHTVNRPILEMPELEETSTELEELHVIFRKNPEKTPDISYPRQFSLRSPPDLGSVNGRRSRASDCLSRTESDLDLSEQRDDISTDGMFADDEDECEVIMCKTYTEPEQGAEVLLSCTIVNSAYKENQRDSFWSDHSLEDLKQAEKTESSSTTPAFRDARQQMKDIHLHLQNLRIQMEQLNDDLAGESLTSDEYLSFSDTKRPITN